VVVAVSEVMVAKVEVAMASVAMVLMVEEEVDIMAAEVEEVSEVVIKVDTREHSHFLLLKLFSSFML
jgi:hypothetical protein